MLTLRKISAVAGLRLPQMERFSGVMKIAAMVKNKMSSKEIASVMYISLETVKAHRKNIRRKLKIHNTKHKLSEYLATVMGNNGEQ